MRLVVTHIKYELASTQLNRVCQRRYTVKVRLRCCWQISNQNVMSHRGFDWWGLFAVIYTFILFNKFKECYLGNLNDSIRFKRLLIIIFIMMPSVLYYIHDVNSHIWQSGVM